MSAVSTIGSLIFRVSPSSKFFFHFRFFSQFLSNQTILFPCRKSNPNPPTWLYSTTTSLLSVLTEFSLYELGKFGRYVCWSWLTNSTPGIGLWYTLKIGYLSKNTPILKNSLYMPFLTCSYEITLMKNLNQPSYHNQSCNKTPNSLSWAASPSARSSGYLLLHFTNPCNFTTILLHTLAETQQNK